MISAFDATVFVIDDDARMRSATELKIMLAAEAFNLLKHPDFSVPSYTQSSF